MPISDRKIIQSLIQGALSFISALETQNTYGQSLISAYQAKSIGATDILTGQEVIDSRNMIEALNTLLTDHAAIIATLKSKDCPSHDTRSLLE